MKKKTLLKGIIKYAIGLVVLGYVIWSNWAPATGTGLSDVWRKHVVEGQPADLRALAAAGILCAAAILLTFVRWFFMVRAQELPLTLGNAIRFGLIGNFCNTFLPGSIGGDIVKAAFIAREQSRRTVAVATVLIDRALAAWGLAWLAFLLGTFFWMMDMLPPGNEAVLRSIIFGTGAVCGGGVLVWFLMGVLPINAERFAGRLNRIPKIGHSAAEFWRAVWMYRCRRHSMWLGLIFALIGHVGFVLTFYFSALTLQAADQIPSVQEHFLIVPIGMVIEAGFPAPGGVGGGEYAYGKLYQLLGKPEANGVLGSFMKRIIQTCVGLLGYFVYAGMRPSLPPDIQEEFDVTDEPLPVKR